MAASFEIFNDFIEHVIPDLLSSSVVKALIANCNVYASYESFIKAFQFSCRNIKVFLFKNNSLFKGKKFILFSHNKKDVYVSTKNLWAHSGLCSLFISSFDVPCTSPAFSQHSLIGRCRVVCNSPTLYVDRRGMQRNALNVRSKDTEHTSFACSCPPPSFTNSRLAELVDTDMVSLIAVPLNYQMITWTPQYRRSRKANLVLSRLLLFLQLAGHHVVCSLLR